MAESTAISSAETYRPEAPQDWDKAVSAAYLRSIGHTQKEAAEGAGVSDRTLRSWEGADWWADALNEAQSRWLNGIRSKARAVIDRALLDPGCDPNLALRISERLEAPLHPKSTVALTGADGKPLSFTVTHEVRGYTEEQAKELPAGEDADG